MRTFVKICGLKTEEALAVTVEAGADLFGIVLHDPSPRSVALETAAQLARAGRAAGGIRSVVLLVDPNDDLLARVASQVAPDMLQLHGRESPDRVRTIRRRTGLPVMKAVGVATRADVEAAAAYLEPEVADVLLFDARAPEGARIPGGNGLAFDWHMLDAVRGRFPFGLAGGLRPDNVAAAIELTGAALVDVSSGVERSPGEKDPELIRRFLRAAKTAKQVTRIGLPI